LIVRPLLLTNLKQGSLPEAMHACHPEALENENLLLFQGGIGKVLFKCFHSLAQVGDWERLHQVVTMALKKQLKVEKWMWIPAKVEPANLRCSLHKTKLRLHPCTRPNVSRWKIRNDRCPSTLP
jgi:hypothetical protein